MKKLILTFILLTLSTAAHAQTSLTVEQAAKYYQSCMARSAADQTMSAETKDKYCQCTAIEMKRSMTMEEVKATTGNDQAARNAINKVMTRVYAPCMQHPVRDLIAQSCATKITNPKICSCVSENMAAYTTREAQTQLPAILAANPNVTDPTKAFMESSAFEQNQKQIAMKCAMQQ